MTLKQIYFTFIVLLLAMSGMAYLYFSRLNTESTYNESSLYAATANSGLIFVVHHDKRIFEILKGQDLLEKIIGDDKFRQMNQLKAFVFNHPAIYNQVANKDVYISFSGGKEKSIDFLISTQLNEDADKTILSNTMLAAGINVTEEKALLKFSLNDSSTYYLGIKKNLLVLSSQPQLLNTALNAKPTKEAQDFIDYIKLNHRLSKNSVASVFIDFNKIPSLIKSILPGRLTGNLAIFNQQNSFAALNYNFSAERLFFSGNTLNRDAGNYLNLFANVPAQKMSIDNLLPENTANFRSYSIPDYKEWRKQLNDWFKKRKEVKNIQANVARINKDYRLNTEEIFPEYFKGQLISFQLKSAEMLGAINLSDGDKVKQLLLDISEDYNPDIKLFKVEGILYSYFGEPFKRFNRPYYTVIDNYLVFANQPSTVQAFLQSYRNNKLLVNSPDYNSLYTQISNTSSVSFYVNHKNSTDLVRRNIFMPYYRHYMSKNHVAEFSSMVYQLNGDSGSFQTNLLINSPAQSIDSISADSLSVLR